MVNAFLQENVSKLDRDRLLKQERRFRFAGEWGLWESVPITQGMISRRLGLGSPGGWLDQIQNAYRNRVFCVLRREVPNETGVVHLAVSSLSGIRPTWPEMQRIKNELAGVDKTAVEVYPPQSAVVDTANMFHIWVLPTGLRFGLSNEEEGECPKELSVPR